MKKIFNNKSGRSILFILVSGLLFFTSCGSPENKVENLGTDSTIIQGTITLSGAFALYPLANIWAGEFRKLHPDVKFNVSAGGAGKGMADALSGSVDIGMLSREIKKEEIEKGAFPIAVAKDAVVPTISKLNPALKILKEKGLSQEKFKGIYSTGEITTWGQALGTSSKEKISLYTRSDAAGAAEVWSKFVGAQGQEGLKGLGVYGDPGLAEALKKDSFALGYNNIIFIWDLNTGKKYDGIEVVPIDVNGNNKIDPEEDFYDNLKSMTAAIKSKKYPEPPARELFLVTKGKVTNPLVKEFLKYVLGDGQKFIEQTGFVKLPAARIKIESDKIK